MKVFLDIGSHIGETLQEVTKDKYAFDKIVCFEPSSFCIDKLQKFSSEDDRIVICEFGLSNRNEDADLFEPGTLGGTIFKSKDNAFDIEKVEKIKLCDTNEWFINNLSIDDYIVVKTNCEGSEVDIIDSLIDGNFMKHIYSFLITFDIREHEELDHREIEVRKRLKEEKLRNFCFSDDVMIGSSHEERIGNWLKLFGIDSDNKDIDSLRIRYHKQFLKYSRKSGFFTRWEIRLKRKFNYNNFPDSLKNILRLFKRILGLGREK